MKVFKELKWDALLKGILYILLGVVALVVPETMEKTLGYLLGIILIIAGGVSIIGYLLREAHENYYRNDFVYGLAGIVIGIIVLLKVEIIISLIPLMLGVLVTVSGCAKLQDVIDMKRMNYGNWIVMLLLAFVNLVLGLLLIFNPFEAASLLFRIIGIGLIFSGVTDCITTVYFAKKIKDYVQKTKPVDSTFEEIARSEETE
jgi:uncharacterized membrane protein HdeD (DUF308 family)